MATTGSSRRRGAKALSERQRLEAALADAPADWQTRLVLADLLEEEGEQSAAAEARQVAACVRDGRIYLEGMTLEGAALTMQLTYNSMRDVCVDPTAAVRLSSPNVYHKDDTLINVLTGYGWSGARTTLKPGVALRRRDSRRRRNLEVHTLHVHPEDVARFVVPGRSGPKRAANVSSMLYLVFDVSGCHVRRLEAARCLFEAEAARAAPAAADERAEKVRAAYDALERAKEDESVTRRTHGRKYWPVTRRLLIYDEISGLFRVGPETGGKGA